MILPQNETRKKAKELYLKRQQSKMLDRFKAAGREERDAVIKNIDLFLSAISKDERIFWLKFRSKLERFYRTTGSHSSHSRQSFREITAEKENKEITDRSGEALK